MGVVGSVICRDVDMLKRQSFLIRFSYSCCTFVFYKQQYQCLTRGVSVSVVVSVILILIVFFLFILFSVILVSLSVSVIFPPLVLCLLSTIGFLF